MEKLNRKKILLLCLPIVFAVSLAIILAACMAQAGKKVDDKALGGNTTPPSAPVLSEPSASDGLSFRSDGNGNCKLIGIGSCTDSEITVPDKSPDGDKVVAVGDSAFIGVTGIDTVKLPADIESVGNYAFYGSSITGIYIPSSVKSIGDCAFANCLSLTAINVDALNESYTSIDGVLFSKDKSTLICYPSGKTGDSYTIRLGVGFIGNAAFLNCVHLKTVSYNGSSTQWATVKIGANNNFLSGRTINYLTSVTK